MFETTNDLLEYVYTNSHAENRYCEFKGVIDWDMDVKYKIIKTILGMSNNTDGGNIIIGVVWNESSIRFEPIGLSDVQALTFQNDQIQSFTNNYADPHAKTSTKIFDWNSKKLVVIKVAEFQETPVICKKGYFCETSREQILENGAVYSRRTRMPETAKVTSVEMREIMKNATQKGVIEQIRFLQASGIIPVRATPSVPSDESQFDNERSGF